MNEKPNQEIDTQEIIKVAPTAVVVIGGIWLLLFILQSSKCN